MEEGWKQYRLIDILDTLIDYRGKTPRKTTSGIPLITAKIIKNGRIEKPTEFIAIEDYDSWMVRGFPNVGDVVLTTEAPLGEVAQLDNEHVALAQRVVTLRGKSGTLNNTYLKYYLLSNIGQQRLKARETGTTVTGIKQSELREVLVDCPPYDIQIKIASILKSLDDKIEVNKRLNDNFEQQAQALFDKMFPQITKGDSTVGNMITPQRGKGLLSKNAIPGEIPVVAGGIEPATFHNVSNTTPPVLTIAASGANAGYINLWHIPVWSSDSSFIDSKMTSNVYFWYVMLKKRQKEIFDAQVGSAQPHIYPKHIAELPMQEVEENRLLDYNRIVTPVFEQIGKNVAENNRLASIRDVLLPKLMSGELKIS